MTTKKGLLWFMIVCFTLIFLMVFTIIIVQWIFSPKNEVEAYEDMWGFELPDEIVTIYHLNTRDGFHGDGVQYTVFELENTSQEFITNFGFKPSSELFTDFQGRTSKFDKYYFEKFNTDRCIEQELSELKEELILDLKDRDYYWNYFKKQESSLKLLVIYDYSESRLYFFTEAI